LRDEVRDPRILRFDPASRAIWSLAVLPGTSSLSAVELTNWTDQILKKRLQNVSGVGAVNMVGGTLREINIYLNPQAMESLGVSAEQIANARRVRSERHARRLFAFFAARPCDPDRRTYVAA